MMTKFFLRKKKISRAHQGFSPSIVLDPLRKNDANIYVLETKSVSNDYDQRSKNQQIWSTIQHQGCGVDSMQCYLFFCLKINKINLKKLFCIFE